VKRLLHDTDVSTPDRRAWEHYTAPAEGTFSRWLADNSLLAMEGEDHARVRRLVSAAFTPRAIARMDSQIQEVVDEFATPLHGRTGVVDLMAELTDPIPNTVISRITGIPAMGGDEARFRRLAQEVIGGAVPFADAESLVTARVALEELVAWVRVLADERATDPRDDLISDVVHTHDMGDRMTSDEIVTLVAGLVSAGSETTSLGGMVAITQLLLHPEVMERMRADRSLVAGAVPEIIRLGMSGPGALPRYATRDFELRGKQITRGQMLMLSFGGANTDPAVFDHPLELDIDRDNSSMLNFGFGPHYCLGVHLAKAELGCMINALLDVMPSTAVIDRDAMEFRSMGMFNRPVTMPVDFGDGL
jgi:cytochrome P450